MTTTLEYPSTRVQKWGNSQGVRIPKEVCEAAGIGVGDVVDISCEPGAVILRAVQGRGYKRAGSRSVAELCAGYEGQRVGSEWLVGRVGAEVVE